MVAMEMGYWCKWQPVVAMLAVVVAFGVMNTFIKKAIDEGIDRLVLITLRQLIATLFMAPIAYFRERKTRPKLTTGIFIHLFFSAMLGATLTQYLFFLGLQYTSATFACAFLNMAPVFTFLLALPFRLEALNVRSKAGIAKLLGTVVCVGGAMLLTLYKGVALTNTSHESVGLDHYSRQAMAQSSRKWIVGSIALLAGCISWSSWFLLQSRVGKKYPALYSGTALIFFLSFLQAASLSLATQRSISVWALKRKLEIITVIFSGVVGSGLGFLTMSWCVEKRGPVFTAAFSPLIQVIVAILDFSVLHEQLHLGSVLGSVLVIAGLYFLLWGKSKEAQSCVVKQVQGDVESEGAVVKQPPPVV